MSNINKEIGPKHSALRILSLVSRGNQDEISKSDAAPQLAETIVIDKNFKKHPQNKVNKKERPQLNKHFSSFTQTETKLWTKSSWKPKTKECQNRSHFIYSQGRPSSKLCKFILCLI